jgi:hypothetical protein
MTGETLTPTAVTTQASATTAASSEAPGTLSATLRAPVNERERVYGDFGGGEYELPTLVEIRMEGILSRYWAYGSLAGTPAGIFGPGGYWGDWDCKLNVVVRFSQGGGFAPCKGPYHDMQTVYMDTVVARGVGSVHRNADRTSYWGRRCGSSFGNNCNSYTGSQSVTVTPVADALQVEASESHVEPGATVTFTASTRDGHPFTVREWTWVPERPSEDEPAREVVCGTGTECTHPVSSRGTMYVSAVVGGRVEQAGALVSTDEPLFVVEVAEIHSDDGAVYPGTAVRFHARTTDGAPFQLLEWSWVADGDGPGATAACAHNDSDCTTAVQESGTMRARADIGGEEHSDGAHVEVVAARLVLECAPAEVVRGATVTCEASISSAAATLETTAWTFTGGGEVVNGPTGSTSWRGVMVVPGTVAVEGLVNGHASTAHADVAVVARTWPDPIPDEPEEFCGGGAGCPLDYPPVFLDDLGQSQLLPSNLLAPLRARARMLGEGPNEGWSYLEGATPPILFDEYRVYLNTVLSSDSDPFWRGRPDCDVGEVLDAVRQHEQVHVNSFILALPFSPVNQPLEDRVVFGPLNEPVLRRMATDLREQIMHMIDVDHRGLYPSLPCDIGLPRRT